MHSRTNRLARSVLLTAVAVVLATPARAQLFVDFEDLGQSIGGGIAIPTSYKGRTWTVSGSPMGWISPASPYTDDVCRSGTNCAYNGFGLPSGVTGGASFTLSGWLRRWNWNNNTGGATSVLIEALNGNTVVGSVTITTSESYQFFQLLAPMTTVRFTPQGGSGISCAQGAANCGYFLLDDLTFDPAADPQPGIVPEPSTYALMLTGIAGLALIARRRRA